MLHRHTLLRFKTENFYSKLCFWKRRQWRHKKSFTRLNVKSSLLSFFAKFANPSLVLERLLLLASYSFIHAHWLTSPRYLFKFCKHYICVLLGSWECQTKDNAHNAHSQTIDQNNRENISYISHLHVTVTNLKVKKKSFCCFYFRAEPIKKA